MNVPKVLHQIWLGPKPIPSDLLEHARTWRDTHSGWERVLWSDRPGQHPEAAGIYTAIAELPPIINAWCYEHAADYVGERSVWAARSDIVRMEIIAAQGGVYADLDVRMFRPMDGLLQGLALGVADELGPCNGNYLFAARRNHPAMWTAVRELAQNFPKRREPAPWWKLQGWRRMNWPGIGILELTGPCYLNGKLQRHPDCVVWPWQLFNPLHARLDWQQVEVWPPSAYGNHCYAGTWYDQIKRCPPKEFLRGVR